jgi:hypothetical protein
MQKRFLNDILSVFGIVNQSIHRVEESILVTADQLTKGRGLTFSALLDESVLVAAHGGLGVGRWKRWESSRNAFVEFWENPIHDGMETDECQKEGRSGTSSMEN